MKISYFYDISQSNNNDLIDILTCYWLFSQT